MGANSITITLRQARSLVEFFGGHDCEVTVAPNLPEQPTGLYAWCTEYPEEGAQFLGRTEVDDELARAGSDAAADGESAWTRNDEATRDVLSLIDLKDVPLDVIAAWTDEQCQQAEQYAGALHFHASDNDDVVVPPIPPHVLPYQWTLEEIARGDHLTHL